MATTSTRPRQSWSRWESQVLYGLLGPARDHVQQPGRTTAVAYGGQVDDDGDIAVAPPGVAPHVLVNSESLHPLESVGRLVEDLLGSGLSLYNYVSAELEVQLLRYAYTQPNIYNTLLPTLPIAGVDGTLKKRMRNTPAEGNVRAKTGTLFGVSSLAGYLTASNGHRLCFAIIVNGGMSQGPMRNLQNKICVALSQ